MKTIKNLNVYQCEFCGKKGLSASHITRHEKYCHKNPDVATMCARCGNLERTSMTVVYENEEFGFPDTFDLNMFRCKVTGKKLYSKQIERKAMYGGGKQLASDIIRYSDEPMPLKKDGCSNYEDESVSWAKVIKTVE